MRTMHGEGDLIGHSITPNGCVKLRVLGKDERTGKWTTFQIIESWGMWNRINESLYNEREEVAQERIPYE